MKRLAAGFGSFIATLVLVVAPVLAAPKSQAPKPQNTLGNDISWPQCGKALPTGQAFGIIGVNGGLATTTNPCLSTQLVWANNSTGAANQPKIQLYVNTANPGGLGTSSWPGSNVDPSGNVTSNPYGSCNGSDSLACAWQYGWNRAVEDVTQRFSSAAAAAGISTDAASYPWWLDVETENTWKSGSTFAYQSNVADLEGMTAHFKSIGATVGLYSTGYQWGQIVGGAVGPSSSLNGLNNWRPGGSSLKTAQQACNATPLTANGRVVLTQFISKNLDYDYSCI